MRIGLLTLISMVVLVSNIFAQDQANQTKYELIRETINFLATDKTVSQDTNFRIACETLDYDCFTQQLSSKPIAGIERWYDRWRSTTATDTAGLVDLRDRIFADIFERQGKGYRKQLAGYKGYISRIEQLIDEYRNGIPSNETAADTSEALSDSLAGLYPTTTEQTPLEKEIPKKDPMIAYLALALGIIALILTGLPMLKKKETPLPPTDVQTLAERMDELALRMKRLERQAPDDPQAKDAVNTLTSIMESVEKRVVDLENRSKPDHG